MDSKNKSYGKKLRNKRILSVFLTLLMVVSMLPISAFQVTANAADDITVKVHFRNTSNWGQVYVYAGDGASWTPLLTSTWPGDQIEKDALGYYTFETTKSSATVLNLVFSDGTSNDAYKTPNLTVKAGATEAWISDNTVSYSVPSGGPTVSGNKVTFTYSNSSASTVYVAGTMNGWSTTANQMTKSGSNFTCTMELPTGMYEYKFVVNGSTWIADPTNGNTIGNNGNSVLVVPGILATNISVKKGSTTVQLPGELTYITASGESTKPVTYTESVDGVSINGNVLTLSEGFSKTEFEITAKTTDNQTATVKVYIYEPAAITVKIHYDRSDNAEKDWNAWIWSDQIGGSGNELKLEGGEYVATYTISAEDAIYINSLNYIIRKGEWVAQEATRTIDLTSVLSGTVHSYVNTDGSYSNDTSEAVLGTKLNSVKYNRGTNKITIKASGTVVNPSSAFVITKSDGSTIKITNVAQSGSTYTLTISEDLTSIEKVCGTYMLTYDGNKYNVNMPNVYKTDEFESLYTYSGNDLGATWTASKTTFKVWAPTANDVKVQLYATGSDKEEGSAKLGTYSMTKGEQGVWTVEVKGNLHGVYYTYLTDVNGQIEESCDPYARTTGVNSARAMVINLDSTDPEGWENDISPNKGMSYTDSIIYELHVRDLSINEESGIKDEWKGKFLGLTQKGTTNNDGIPTGLDHIKDLGVTHIHLLPVYDFGSIDETMTEEDKAANTAKQFNWGYDPMNYNVPEGSYSTNPYDGNSRVKEMKEMVQTLHENNINVIMDVVYNHVYDAGNFGFNEIVPNYFSRTNADGTYSNGSGCGNDTASERSMVRKYIVDSVKYWADEYHIDGFRFDLVGLLDAETINQVVDEVHKTHPDVVFYGEGWTMGTAVEPSDTVMATQQNAYATPNFAYFSDTFRDFLKGKNDEVTWGYVQGATEGDQEGTLIDCFMANTSWIQNPTQVINYASCHDNYTLKDKINATRSDTSESNRIKMNNLAAAIYMMAEGIPLIHAGEEMLRTKVDNEGNIIHNSYNSPDYINSLKWGDLDLKDYQEVRDYYKGLIEFRKNHAALRLTTKAEVKANVESIYFSDNVVGFRFNGKNSVAKEVADEIVVIFNATSSLKVINLSNHGFGSGTWKICVDGDNAGTDVLATVSDNTVSVSAYSAMVLVKGETVDNNSVYKANEVEETGRVNIEYVDEDGNVLETSSISGAIGAAYQADAIEIEGYTVKTTPSNANGKYTSKDIFVTYVYEKNTVVLKGWQSVDGKWYYYDANGVMQKSKWAKIGSYYYYFDANGVMQANKWINNKYYVKSNGVMAVSEFVDGARYYVDENGVWVTGTKWLQISGKWYYLKSGVVQKSKWTKIGTSYYYFDANGVMQSSRWVSNKYYVKSNGVMATSEFVDGGKYYVDENGAWVTGTKWLQVSGKWYYLTSGVVQTSRWVKVGTKWYYFDAKGVMQTSRWISNTYYVKADGSMAVSEWVDNGRYYVDENGKWVKNP
ncbi:MAG: type I pullulanase [Lachnospiraceae bacterium]|nr:type I pullulanase [Lachnospiraceae bacterium]